MYYAIFTVVGTVLEISLAIAMDRLAFKKLRKVMQSILVIPIFISFTAVQFIVYAFLSPDQGMINNLFGLRKYRTIRRHIWRCLFRHLLLADFSIYRQ